MRHSHPAARLFKAALLAPLFATLLATAEDKPVLPASGISVTIGVVRTDAAKGQFLCTAEVTDLASGEVLAAPKISFTSESGAKAKTGSRPDVTKPASEIVLDVSANKAGDSASYSVSYTKEGVLVAVQKGSLSLR
ncbi:MAG: hypothetical protein ABI584_12485 [Acidobacteriota bacterium]